MEFDPTLILIYLGPVFALFIAWEWYTLSKNATSYPATAQYSLTDTVSNLSLALMHELGEVVAALVVIGIYYWVFDFRLFDIPNEFWAFGLLFMLQDFCYYWFHRASHRVRWMWSAHVVHHSSEHLNFSTAFRQSIMYPIAGMWVFWVPLIALGFEPMTVISVVLCNLAYQFFIHTETIKKLPSWFEAIFNTPSHHRVHHGKNPQYLDKNYAGTLIIWDKLFNTFAEEDKNEFPDYGLVKDLETFNPIRIAFHEYWNIFKDMVRGDISLKQKFFYLFAPPGWSHDGSRKMSTDIKREFSSK
jgi:sterol desaturase/sphingolipid hydroxylase (fatty acid hydroxylase superfamily)